LRVGSRRCLTTRGVRSARTTTRMRSTRPRSPLPMLSDRVPVPVYSPALAARAAALIDRADVLSAEELEALVRRIGDRPELWRPLVVADRERRRYELL